MKKQQTIGHPILERIAKIDRRLIEGLDVDSIPKDPQFFLNWWWGQAKGCLECPLSLTRNQVVKPDGDANAKIMVVGEGPGFLEDLTSIPMVGPMDLRGSHCSLCSNVSDCFGHRMLPKMYSPSKPAKAITCKPNYTGRLEVKGQFYIRSAGAIFDGILVNRWKFNYPRHNWIKTYNLYHPTEPWKHSSPWFITNAVLCRSTDASKLKDSPPESLPRQRCRKWFIYQWAAVQPELIVAFGRIALALLMGNETAARTIQPNTFVETKFGPVLFQNHPAYFMREKGRNAKAYGFAKIESTLTKALEYVGLPTK